MRFLARLFAAFLVFSLAPASGWAAVLSGKASGVLIVEKTVALPSGGYAASMTAKVGAAGYSGPDNGYILSANSENVDVPSGISLQHITYAGTPAGSTLINQAKAAFLPYKSQIANGIKAYVTANGLAGGLFKYAQNVEISGRPGESMILYWQVFATADGRVIDTDIEILPPRPTFVWFKYTPKAADPGVVTNALYDDPGKLSAYLVDENFDIIRNIFEINTNGAFDEPVYTEGGPVPAVCTTDGCDPEWAVRCLIDPATGQSCPSVTGFTSMKKLMTDLVAQGGYIDYTRSLAPVFDETCTGPADDPDCTYEARLSIKVNSRSINFNSANTYYESGTLGTELESVNDRFRVGIDGWFDLVGQSKTPKHMPDKAFSKQAALPAGAKCVSYAPDIIIDPLKTTNLYNWRNDTVNGLPASRYFMSPLSCVDKPVEEVLGGFYRYDTYYGYNVCDYSDPNNWSPCGNFRFSILQCDSGGSGSYRYIGSCADGSLSRFACPVGTTREVAGGLVQPNPWINGYMLAGSNIIGVHPYAYRYITCIGFR